MIVTPLHTLQEDLPSALRNYAFNQRDGKLPLTVGKQYVVCGTRFIPPHKYCLIMGDSDGLYFYPWWYPAELFKIVDSSIPADWITRDDEGYSIQSFPELAADETGWFANNLDDGEAKEMKVFMKYYEKYARHHGLWYTDKNPTED